MSSAESSNNYSTRASLTQLVSAAALGLVLIGYHNTTYSSSSTRLVENYRHSWDATIPEDARTVINRVLKDSKRRKE